MWRSALVATNSAIRVGYGVLALLAPSRPVGGVLPLAPDTEGFPQARLFIRGFAAHQVVVGLVGLTSLLRPELQRAGMVLAATTDIADVVSAAVEAHARGQLGSDLRDGIVFSSAGLVSALAALRHG